MPSGPPRGGAGRTMTPGPMDFKGPIRGPIEMTLTNQFVENRRPFFFFLRSHQNPEKIVAFSSSVLEYTKPEMPDI